MNPNAIVLDNSGTLLKRFKAIKNVKTNEFIHDINSLTIIDNLDFAALVILQFNTKSLLKINPNTSIFDLISQYNIDFTVSYSSKTIDESSILNIIKKDSTTISDLQMASNFLKNKFFTWIFVMELL